MANGYIHEIIQAAEDLGEGDQVRIRCPACQGGSEKEKSLSIGRGSGAVQYKCHRASCGIQGGVASDGRTRPRKVKTYPSAYSGALVTIPPSIMQERLGKYGISEEKAGEQGIAYAEDINRIRFPVYDYRGYTIGENLRAVSPNQRPKNLFKQFNDVPLIHFPLGQPFDKTLVLVEDQISAIKVAGITYCSALMGTSISEQGLTIFKLIGISKLILMLDGDVPGRRASIKTYAQASSFFTVYQVFGPEGKDPKDLSTEEIYQCLEEYL